MIAVTIGVGEYYARLALHAARAVQRMTGLETVVLDDTHFAASGLPYCHHLKLRLFDLVDDDSVMYFDADMVCLNPWDPKRFEDREALVAVSESARPLHIHTSRDWEIPVREYFNAGLMILNRYCHQEWLRETERFILTDTRFAQYDPYDQAALNITRHRLGLKLDLLDRRYNWIGFGNGRLSYEVPVFMAHGLKPENKFANIDFFEGRYKPSFRWQIDINEEEMNRLKKQTLYIRGGDKEESIGLNGDGTIGPPYFPGIGQYWFVHSKSDSPMLSICSEAEILQEFTWTDKDCWESIERLELSHAKDLSTIGLKSS